MTKDGAGDAAREMTAGDGADEMTGEFAGGVWGAGEDTVLGTITGEAVVEAAGDVRDAGSGIDSGSGDTTGEV